MLISNSTLYSFTIIIQSSEMSTNEGCETGKGVKNVFNEFWT